MTNVSASKNWARTSCCHEAAVSEELQRESLRVTTSRSGENCLAIAAISAVPGDKRSPFSVDQFRLLKFTVALAWQSEKRFGAQIPRLRGGPSARFHNGRSYEHSGLPHSNFYAEARGVAGCSERAFANSPPLLDVVVTPEAVSSDARTGLALGSRSPAVGCLG